MLEHQNAYVWMAPHNWPKFMHIRTLKRQTLTQIWNPRPTPRPRPNNSWTQIRLNKKKEYYLTPINTAQRGGACESRAADKIGAVRFLPLDPPNCCQSTHPQQQTHPIVMIGHACTSHATRLMARWVHDRRQWLCRRPIYTMKVFC